MIPHGHSNGDFSKAAAPEGNFEVEKPVTD